MPKKGPREWSPRGEIPGQPIWPKFVDAYLEAALWSSMDEDEKPLDDKYGEDDWSQEAIDQAVEESNAFIKENLKDLEAVGTQAQHGHDFWLTRNGHGAGFWDRGYGARGKRLAAAAKAYGYLHPYVGVGDKIYFEGG